MYIHKHTHDLRTHHVAASLPPGGWMHGCMQHFNLICFSGTHLLCDFSLYTAYRCSCCCITVYCLVHLLPCLCLLLVSQWIYLERTSSLCLNHSLYHQWSSVATVRVLSLLWVRACQQHNHIPTAWCGLRGDKHSQLITWTVPHSASLLK